ncbi:PA14 domain-containing protein [Cesiribacter sp. SM1]|uniref:PKD domain-containing protein n=1 Tax=Cesiribacter sp. SM1 TaxID=2861196 RepID=UPI001CD28305|nr:PA14 domain-containing protein [Cesiribacter sp. SM1]
MKTYLSARYLKEFITGFILTVLFLLSTPLLAQDCGCDYTISTSQGYIKASDVPAIKPGSTVCIKAGVRGRLKLMGFKGTAEQPITFINCGGKVIFDNTTQEGTFIFENSRYFRVTGSGDPAHKYGFLIRTAPKGSAMGVSESDFEIDHVEIADAGFAGIISKIDPTCTNNQYHRANFTMRNVSIHDNYIHDTYGEGMYIGSTSYGGKSSSCGTLYPHVIEGLRIYNNRIENTGADGLQVSSATKDVAVYNNTIYRYGQDPFQSSQINGLMIGGGSTGKYYNNSVIEGKGMGICSFGIADLYLYNNLVVRSGGDGIFIDERTPILPNSGNHVHNNTVVSSGKYSIRMLSRNSVGNTFYNNLMVAPGTLTATSTGSYNYLNIVHSDIKYVQSNNVNAATVKDAYFVDAATGNYQLQQTSPAIDKGKTLTYFNFDFKGTSRPQGSSYDAGAFEFSGSVRTDNQLPVVSAGSDKSVTLPTNSITLSGTASDADGSIASTTWTKVSGPSASMSGASTLSLKLSSLLEGTYNFRLTAKDNAGATKTDDVVLTVKSQTSSTTTNGLSYKYYTTTSGSPWKVLPNFSSLTPAKTGTISNFSLSPKTQSNYFAFLYEGQIQIDAAGTYTFYTYSDDGSQLFINGNLVANNDGAHAAQERSGSVYLAAGKHNIKVTYFEHVNGETLAVKYSGPGISKQTIPDSKLFKGSSTTINAAPTVSAGSDKTITLPTNSITLSGTASDADGTVASVAWSKISGATVTMSGTSTLSLSLSNLLEGTYTFRLTAKDNAGATRYDDVVVNVKSSTTSSTNGLNYKYYTTSSSNPWKLLPDFSKLTVVKTGTISNFSISPKTQSDYFGFVYEGQIQIDAAGTYTFYAYSDDGSQLFIDGSMVVNNDGTHGAQERSGSVYLAAGRHSIRVTYFDYINGETLAVKWAGPGISKQTIPNTRLFTGSSTSTSTASVAAAGTDSYSGSTSSFSTADTTDIEEISTAGNGSTDSLQLASSFDETPALTAYPNPASDYLEVELGSSFRGKVNLLIINMAGQLQFSKSLDTSDATSLRLNLNEAQLQPGLYILKASDGLSSKSLKIIKK